MTGLDDIRAQAERQERVRRVYAEADLWIVREVSAPAFDRRGGTHLVFESLNVMRRVRVFPSSWYDLSDEQLYALSLDIKSPDGS